jgi:hypothetical protein
MVNQQKGYIGVRRRMAKAESFNLGQDFGFPL